MLSAVRGPFMAAEQDLALLLDENDLVAAFCAAKDRRMMLG